MIKMKLTYKLLLLSIALLGITNVYAQDWWGEAPQPQMRSTSSMPLSESTLPFSARNGVSTTYTSYTLTEELFLQQSDVQKRARPEDWNDPYPNPIGDIPWAMMLVCILIYVFVMQKKSRVKVK